ncbi:MAG: BatB protein, partial [Proteobacteria bacterium]|nr:BatB protein [Pseudomonadota bacterium]
MIQFVWPWLIVLLPLPWLVRYFIQPVKAGLESALRVPFLSAVPEAGAGGGMKRQQSWPLSLAVFGWCLLIVSSMRPQWLGELVEIPVTGRDLMLAV